MCRWLYVGVFYAFSHSFDRNIGVVVCGSGNARKAFARMSFSNATTLFFFMLKSFMPMKELKIFENPQFGEIRTAGTSDNPMFCLADVCKALDLTSTKVAQRLSDDVLSKHPISDSMGRSQQALFISEDGLYDVILDSRKPEAKAFRKWVTGEVLPSIRKTGGYLAASPDDTPEMIMAKALKVADATMRRQDAELKAAKSTLAALKEAIGKADSLLRGEASESEMGSVETASSSKEVAEPAPAPSGKMALAPDEKYVKVVEDPRYEDPSDYWKNDGMDNWMGLGSYARPKAMSATRLLKKTQAGGVGFPEFRDAMRRGGYLERVGIKTKDGRWETHCRLTKRGLHWGFNESHGQDTKVYYYVDRFDDLIDCLGKRGLLS